MSVALAGEKSRRRTAKLDGPHPIDIHVGARIRTSRALAGLNQTELAKRVGVTFQSIQKYERGTNRVSASRLQEIADVLGVPVSSFFEGMGRSGEGVGQTRPWASAPSSALTEDGSNGRITPREIRELNAGFAAIKDKALRQAVLHLLRNVAELGVVTPLRLRG
ncbi:MAG TPA: helix-turn-helix domain-containing protein [Stellaceae bacterium]|nr:helix-turn-helix domain-containing protein [Stellaceae bacterium]